METKAEAQQELLKELAEQTNNLGAALDAIGAIEFVDKRSLAVARTQLTTGFLWLRRAIEAPDGGL